MMPRVINTLLPLLYGELSVVWIELGYSGVPVDIKDVVLFNFPARWS